MKKLHTILLIGIASLALAFGFSAQAENLEQPIEIVGKDGTLVQEFRANGQVYMIKVTPKKGPAYYLIDTTGDGELDSRKNELEPKMLIPSWVLFSW